MVNPIPDSVRKIWDNCNIRGVILFSLSLQMVLILFASLRNGTGNKLVISVVWSAYLLADWVANFGVGLITERARDTPDHSKQPAENNELLAFWVPFLLSHLGSPDTITAFALEDNEFWPRHLFGFIFQVVAAVYVFLLTLPGNKLFIPTILMFIAGVIKYFERILALYLASVEKFRESTLRELAEHYQKRDIVIKKDRCYLEVGCQYFKIFKGILLELMSNFKRVNFAGPFFGDFSPEDALGIIEVELNLVYEVLYTKIQVTHSVLGITLRLICFGSVVAALSFFYFHVEKHGFFEFDVCVTYALFLGAMALDIISFFFLIFSDWTLGALGNDDNESRLGNFKNRIASILQRFIILKSPRWHSHSGGGESEVLDTPFLLRRWSGSVAGLSWITYWVEAPPSRVQKVNSYLHLLIIDFVHRSGVHKIFEDITIATNKLIQFLRIYKIIALLDFNLEKLVALFGLGDVLFDIRIKTSISHEPLTKELWRFIFDEMKRKAQYADDPEVGIKRICSATGDCTLQEFDTNGDLIAFMRNMSATYRDFSLIESVIIWHVATELLYYTAEKVSNEKTYNARELSKILSDYMLYLLQLKPALLNSTASFSKFRLRDTCVEAKKFFEEKSLKPNPVKFACEKIMLEFNAWEVLLSVLNDAIKLANELQKLEKDMKWELVSKVWVELLSYGASHCRPKAHAQQVTSGGELITFVWLLLLHFDLVEPKS
ncbi:DUF4220 domain-containing protein [Citrus sinensis]|uniref:DUF4220 domain-containing protein n=1 Tax=Citrus clementina TaxID=85681 RepID=V4SVY1_CITCL|nr:uncharacterized protein LOC18037852 [Citrus x clementina]XP_015385043.1 uncharacterized protein LOC107176718 [Citrus sinensis]ESR41321.1 hypothetical protein CICLE_v10027077mg [Citrus x clementina]KAH9669762.1 DUF4220 domain-containing protein [Citrus sinensis]